MIDQFIRAPAYLAATVVAAGVLAYVIQYLRQPMAASDAADGDMLFESLGMFASIETVILIGGFAILVGLVAAAVHQSRVA